MWNVPYNPSLADGHSIELHRMYIEEWARKNTESKVIAQMLDLMEKKGYKRAISYASGGQEHRGSIYRALSGKGELFIIDEGMGANSADTRAGRKNKDLSEKTRFMWVFDAEHYGL